ncbi:MAG: Na+/H+ antiporter NhaC family protein [Sulfurimonas sp.]|uniref:Na+/H+ antiporter NhaC family protein n=1 Tax=Sulfurimonas sp. TaxID=2022749 RepID=UPI0026145DB0|nr:Na+/H+ antiporter NhaC family protein [Sulfurimonas sp.]MDD2651424.1 Na+/H+ antiporter NhaC family protein [Sulfurimonas sp.]MDD3450965.1 Na+/H+ antiporter NhaC family protein [Sulfurimonas sp.]
MLAIALSLWTRNVMLSLFGGIALGAFILHDFSLFASLETIVKLFFTLLLEPWILKTLAFAVLVGSIMALIERSGGIEGFVDFMQHKAGLVKSPRAALMLSYFIGVVIFVESSITSLIAGAVGKPFCQKYKIPSAKLAFVCDSTSAPISSLIILNGWGALLLGLIATQISLGVIDVNAIDILIDAVFYNFYSMAALLVTFLFIWFNIDIGAMKNTKYTPRDIEITSNGASMFYMLLPIALMVLLVFVFLYITGGGDILKGSGSSSIFYTMLTVLFFTLFYFVGTKNMSLSIWSKTALDGAWKLVPIAMILLFAFAIGEITTELKTGHYLASLATQNLSVTFLAAVIFLIGSVISFATGTSWGTFSIMIPIALPMAVAMDANVALCIGAVISGGVFGDHCSPISDTTIISSMASDCELIEHVNTQLPYALISGGVAFVLFVLFGLYQT